jgi:hypothetical protein
MKASIDVLMVILLTVFIGSFIALMIFGQVWDINLSMTDRSIQNFDRERTQNAFISSCFCIASGACMLYIIETRLPQDEKADNVQPQTIPHP